MPDRTTDHPAKSSAQTLERGLQVLEAVARATEPLSVAEIAVLLGINRTVVHRMVFTLAAHGYLHRQGGGGYRLGSACLALASAVTDLRALSRPYLEDLARRTDETVHLVVVSGPDVIFVDGIESSQALRVVSRTGRRLPAHATSVGKAWLAVLDTDRFHQLYPEEELASVTPQTITSRTDLVRTFPAIRRRGYATSHGESELGVGSVGCVVLNPNGELRAAMSVAVPLSRMTNEVISSISGELLKAASQLGESLP